MARFSIIITSFNQQSFIRQAVESALGQEYVDKEIIVVDDPSTDGSRAILSEFGNRIKLSFLQKTRERVQQGTGAFLWLRANTSRFWMATTCSCRGRWRLTPKSAT